MPYLTPDDIPGDYVIRVLRIPKNTLWLGLVGGALSTLYFSSSWEAFGAVTPEEASHEMKRMMDTFYEGSGMIGAIVPYATEEIPDTMLPCDGSSYSEDDYPLLYARLPSTLKYGSGLFLTPNLGGRMIAGAGANGSLTTRDPFDIGGAETVTLTEAQMPSHFHTVNMTNTVNPVLVPGSPDSSPVESIIAGVNTNSTGGDEAHNNMPPFYVLSYGIVFA